MTVLLDTVVELQGLDKRRRVNESHLAGVQLRKQPGQLIENRVLIQGLRLQGEDARAEGGVHVEALEYAVGIAGGSQVGQPGRRLGGLAEVLGGVGTEAADVVAVLLPQAGLPRPAGASGDQPAEAVGRVLGVPVAALAEPAHIVELPDVVGRDGARGMYPPAVSPSKDRLAAVKCIGT